MKNTIKNNLVVAEAEKKAREGTNIALDWRDVMPEEDDDEDDDDN